MRFKITTSLEDGKGRIWIEEILIVEDDKVLNKTLAYNLTADGYEVTSAYSFQDAVERLKKSEFDIALLDINLPDGNGLHLCDEIRGRGQHTYIMFITANDKEGDMLKGYEAGCTDYITKPFSVMVLCKKVAAVFANMELRTPKHDVFEQDNHLGDYQITNESIGLTVDDLNTLRKNEAVQSVAAIQFSLYEQNENGLLDEISLEFQLKPGETFQVVGLNDEYWDYFMGDQLPEEQLGQLKSGNACIVRNPIPMSYGEDVLKFTNIEAGESICVAGMELDVLKTLDGYDG